MAPRIVLITGCSTGIGMATAALLANEKQHGFKVYATMRNLGSKGHLEKAAGDTLNKTLFIRELDVTKDDTIKTVVGEILSKEGKIDVLVNNAGYMGIDSIDQKSMEWCQAMFDTNYWGVVRCIRAVLPAMKKQKSGRIINVTSMAGIIATPFYATYAATKFAVEGFSEAAAPTLRDAYNIRVSLVEPGAVKTELITKAMATPPQEECKNYDDALRNSFQMGMRAMQQRMMPVIQNQDEIAKLHLEIILSDNPHLRYQTSPAMKQFAATKLKDITTDAMLDLLKV